MVRIKGQHQQEQQSLILLETMNHHPMIHYLMKKDILIYSLAIYLVLIMMMIPSILSEPAPEPTLVGK